LFNAQGELVGITTFYLKEGQSLNFALPVEWIAAVARKKIREHAKIIEVRPYKLDAPEPPARPKEDWEDRGRPPAKTRFTKAPNGVITDSATGLEWYVGLDRDTTWRYAKSWVEQRKEGGGGWRMPTIAELKTLYQPGADPKNMDPIFQTTGRWVWSGQVDDEKNYYVLYFDFFGGAEIRTWPGNAENHRAFAVRSRR
jgi:hypothetical protein